MNDSNISNLIERAKALAQYVFKLSTAEVGTSAPEDFYHVRTGDGLLYVTIILPLPYKGKTRLYLLKLLRMKAKELQLHVRDIQIEYQQKFTVALEIPGEESSMPRSSRKYPVKTGHRFPPLAGKHTIP